MLERKKERKKGKKEGKEKKSNEINSSFDFAPPFQISDKNFQSKSYYKKPFPAGSSGSCL